MYSTITGDTFDSIARKEYGSEENASVISSANPGVSEPLVAGIVLVIPIISGTPIDVVQNTDSNSNTEVALLIDGQRFRFWTNLRLTRAVDGIDIVEFDAPFDPMNLEFRNIFKPMSFKPVTITLAGVVIFTGVLVNPIPVLSNNNSIVSVSCYSLPGVLNDSVMPASSYPIAYDDIDLKELATTLCKPFGITVKFTAPIGELFERVAIKSNDTVLAFLIGLAQQRNLIISSTPLGELLFQQSISGGAPITILQQGQPPLIDVTPMFNPQDYYSHITGIKPTVTGQKGSQFTVKNSLLNGVIRATTFDATDTPDGGMKQAVEAKTGRMFANMISYNINVSGWYDGNGKIWETNKTIILQAPRAMIYDNYEFLIRNIDFKNDKASTTATMNLVIPGAFAGKIPESLPWDE